jgi:hypothetical protein
MLTLTHRPGDTVTIESNDGQILHFKIEKISGEGASVRVNYSTDNEIKISSKNVKCDTIKAAKYFSSFEKRK